MKSHTLSGANAAMYFIVARISKENEIEESNTDSISPEIEPSEDVIPQNESGEDNNVEHEKWIL